MLTSKFNYFMGRPEDKVEVYEPFCALETLFPL